MNVRMTRGLSSLFILASGWAAQAQVSDLSLHQSSWFNTDGSSVQPNSLWGRVAVTYTPTPTQMFLNVSLSGTSNNSNPDWAVQNMPLITSSMDPVDSTLSEGVDVNLADLGVTEGSSWSGAFYSVTVSSSAQSGPAPVATTFAGADSFTYESSDWPSEDVVGAGSTDPGIPKGMKDNPAPLANALNGFVARRMNSVQEGINQCFAGACSRSLDWLNRTQGYNFPGEAQDIFSALVAAGVSVPNADGSIARNRWVNQKSAYARANSGNDISTEVWDSGTFIDGTKIGTASRTTGNFLDWFNAQFKKGQDVELIYNYPGSAHAVTITGTYVQGGQTYLLYRDDEVQGDATKGDGVGGKAYAPVKRMHVYSNNGTDYFFGADRNRITWAVAESPGAVPEPSAVLGLGLGCLALVARKRRSFQ